MREFTTEALRARRRLLREFKIDLPGLLPEVDWPNLPDPAREPTESDLLFERLFLLHLWPPPGSEGTPPDFPLTLLGKQRPPTDEVAEAFLQALAREIENDLALTHPDLMAGFPDLGIKGFRELPATVYEQSLSSLTHYRLWLAIKYLTQNIDSDVFTQEYIRSRKQLHSGAKQPKKADFDRLARTQWLFDEFKRLWNLPANPKKPDASEPRSGTTLDNWGLPDDMIWVPDTICDVARAIQAVPPEDLDPVLAEEVTAFGFQQLKAEHDASTLGRFNPLASKSRDPVFLAVTLALDAVLRPDLPTLASRADLIRRVLNAVYPQGYRSSRHPLGSRRPTAAWPRRRIEDAAKPTPAN